MIVDPIDFAAIMWPDTKFYREQVEIIRSVQHNDETIVVAGNKLGKDYTAAFICLWYFLTHHPVRIVATSVKDDHLRVLFGEIEDFINRCKYPLVAKKKRDDMVGFTMLSGGPLILKHHEINKFYDGDLCKKSYIRGMVSERGEGLQGHHAAYTLGVIDEACHDQDTEVLTDSGWKYFKNITMKDQLLSMNPYTRDVTFSSPTKLYQSYKSGEMYLYESKKGNFLVTPNHKMLWRLKRDYKLRFETIDKYSGSRWIPRKFLWSGTTDYSIPEFIDTKKIKSFIELLGWYCSEGCLVFDKNILTAINISQKIGSNLDRIFWLTDEIGMKASRYNYPCTDSSVIRIYHSGISKWLMSYGRYCWEKRVPDFIHQLPPDLIRVFLESYIKGDGTNYKSGGKGIYTSSKAMANDLQILSYKAGMAATVRNRNLKGSVSTINGRSVTTQHDAYIVSISVDNKDYIHLCKDTKGIKKVDYSGMVYCAQVEPYHTLFTRRDGYCMWSGNSGVEDSSYEYMATWSHKMLVFGNPLPPKGGSNFFYSFVKQGDIPRKAR